MQISTQSRKRLLFAALFLAILIPLFFTLAIRSQLPLLGFEGGSPPDRLGTSEYDWQRFLAESDRGRHLLQPCAPCEGLAPRGAAVFPEHRLCCDRARSALGDAVLQKELSHTVYDRLYDFVRAHLPGHHGDYAINSQAEEYCVLMLWGAYLREGRGLGSVLVYLTVVGCYFVSLARSRKAA